MIERVLIVHNIYQQSGGEDSVVDAEVRMLRSRDHPVEFYSRHNNEISSKSIFRVIQQIFWSGYTVQDVRRLIDSFKPDIIHIHNTFPLISPSIYWEANRSGIPIVQTLHNFRLLCPQAMFLRESKVCEDCLGKVPWRGVVRGCYRGSRSKSLAIASMVTMHRAIGTWYKKITRFIVFNEFCRQKFIEGGLPAERIVVKPNFVDYSSTIESSRQGFLFVGRLSVEKGLSTLLKAIVLVTHAQLRVAGVGPESVNLEGVTGVVHLGRLNNESVRNEMIQTIALVVPSICYETFGMVIVEAFSTSTPVIASRIGSLPELVENGVTGLLFEHGNSEDLAEKILWAQNNPEQMRQMGRNALKKYQTEYTADQNYNQLIAIYRDAIDESKIK
jgi:glycosyltransferase involved in cell wall biosynthesis